jgi:hypothetical protein
MLNLEETLATSLTTVAHGPPESPTASYSLQATTEKNFSWERTCFCFKIETHMFATERAKAFHTM